MVQVTSANCDMIIELRAAVPVHITKAGGVLIIAIKAAFNN
jgi:hypothetical protein